MTKMNQLALIALGSNENSVWGDAKLTVQKGMSAVSQLTLNAAQFSDLYATPAYPAGAGPDFVNAAMAIYTNLSPNALLAELHRIEAEAGRERNVRWGQRTLDLDLIAVGSDVLPDRATQQMWRDLTPQAQQQMTPSELILPHPRMQDRSFVLVPLADVAPDWCHPALGQTIATLCAALPDADRASMSRLSPSNLSLHTP